MSDWYFYLVRCRDGSLYTGISTDVARRLAQHRGEGSAGSKYLKGRGPFDLSVPEEFGKQEPGVEGGTQSQEAAKGKKRRTDKSQYTH